MFDYGGRGTCGKFNAAIIKDHSLMTNKLLAVQQCNSKFIALKVAYN